ncbi:MAG: hypothetical protein DRP57_08630 [Spirochaetes bacterium]|nr:MAG: hypothetical protein DRP57_08630 [Spirochaetota bacterium]
MHRRAPFIWTPEQKIDFSVNFRSLLREGPVRRNDGTNRWYLFRYEFKLDDAPEEAVAKITADGRYKLFINGERVSRGPARSSPSHQRFSITNIEDFLISGTNTIGVIVHVYGCDTAWYESAKDYWQSVFGDGALWFECDIKSGTDKISVFSSKKWKCIECRAWNNDTPREGWGQDFIEDFDARKMPGGWNISGFNDSEWKYAKELKTETDESQKAIGFGRIEPFPVLMPSGIPEMRETSVKPNRVIRAYGVKPSPELPMDREIYDEVLTEPVPGQVENPDNMLFEGGEPAILKTTNELDVSILIAFGKRHAGYPFIELEAVGGEVVEVAVSETLPGEYTNKKQYYPRISNNIHLDCAHLFRYTARPGFQRFEKFEWTAIKYLQITVRNAPTGLRIHRIGSIHTHFPAENRGAFTCSDKFLNRLWESGRYTTLECTHDAWEDCPSREKRQWFGDGIVHYLVNAVAFGPSTLTVDKEFIMAAAESQRPDGLIQMFAPGDHHTSGIIIPDFNLHWVLVVYYYLLYTGDSATIEDVFPSIQRSLGWFQRQMGSSGLLSDIPYWHFIEWANVGREGDSAIINAMFVGALNASAEIAEYLDYPKIAFKYKKLAESVKNILNSRFWDSSREIYVDSVDSDTSKQNLRVSQHTNAFFILWEIAPRKRWPAVIEYITDPLRVKLTNAPPMVTNAPAFNEYTDVVKTNTFFSHFLYSALAKAGRFDIVLKIIRDDYRDMLMTGTETLWESFIPGGSMCHAFSCTPTYQLSAHVLGIRPEKPGFTIFQCAPQDAGLSYAHGVYPTVKGDITISWEHKDESFILRITVPPSTLCNLVPPPGFKLPPGREPELFPGQHEIRFMTV